MAGPEGRPWTLLLLLQRAVPSVGALLVGRQTISRVDEKREPLKSKSNEGRSTEKACGKKKGLGSYEKEAEEQGGPQARAEPPLLRERVVPASLALDQELSQAMLRMDMALEREYAFDIFSNLMRKQPSYAFQGFDLPRSVTVEMRALLVDWLVQVHEYLNLADETLHLAVHLMNSYLRAGRVRIPCLQLLSATCLFLACKLEEHTCPEPAQLCFMMENSCSRKDLLQMERKILARLRFELHYANPIHLFRLLAEVAHCTLEVQFLALYFLEASLMEVDCLRFEPAQLSFAALSLAHQLSWEARIQDTGALQQYFPKFLVYSEAELLAVFPYMAKAVLQGANASLRAIFLKYSRPQKLCVSTNPAIAASKFLSRFLGDPPQ
ncbi:cyclin N-terminal domain-containing protein 2 [Notechis scutatus]|uniref:Cyclin N-terminal domain-containing protein 2 n=1 Tax=Notechis scutatus TaxID=8663 RepID=A0A6J1VUD0_9SAUR|nr:cyclin N-terminal domain-containing protein 2 [Notechis scutatus]